MDNLEEFKELICNGKELVVNNIQSLKEICQSILDDPINIIRYAPVLTQIKDCIKAQAPFLYPTWKFWNNVDKFFNGGMLSNEDKQKLIKKLSSDKNKNETVEKIITIIKNIDANRKMAYILNSTKALANDRITLTEYFRICHVIMNTLDEDLQFLKAHIHEEDLLYSVEISGLVVSGLAYVSGFREKEVLNYSFTPIAKAVNECALIGEVNLISSFNLDESPQTKFFATDEEFSAMLDDVFGKNVK